MVNSILIDEKIANKLAESKEPVRFYGNIKIGVPCNWVLIPLKELEKLDDK